MRPKTVQEWLDAIPMPKARAAALLNLEQGRGTMPCNSMEDAISRAFKWKDSPEGGPYWLTVSSDLHGYDPDAPENLEDDKTRRLAQAIHKRQESKAFEKIRNAKPTAQNTPVECIAAPVGIQPRKPGWVLPEDAKERKKYPLGTMTREYFPDALLLVSRMCWEGNQQHHPDKPLHWDKNKSSDEIDAQARHFVEGEWVAVAWRALAQLQRQCDAGYNPYNQNQGEQP